MSAKQNEQGDFELTENKTMRVLVVDDEELGRKMVRRMLENYSEVEIIGECESGEEAITEINAKSPDLVFLDVQMPEIDGFMVLSKINQEHLPFVIFVTAYDEYALRAFEVNALDYLLKPYDRKRFDQAFQRAVNQINHQNSNLMNEKIISLLSENRPTKNFTERFVIKSNGRVFFLDVGEILWIEADGNYVFLHTAQKKHIFRETLTSIESKLNPNKFRQISRSIIVNLNFIKELQPFFRGNYKILLKNGAELKLSFRYRDNFVKNFGGSL